MLHACILFQKTTVSAIICSRELCTKKQTTKNGKNHKNMKQNRHWWRDRYVINHVICFHSATELCSWYHSCNIKNNNHTDTKMLKIWWWKWLWFVVLIFVWIKHDLRGIPRSGGIMCSKQSRHPLKSKMGSTYLKIKRVPLFSETFRYFALRYWTIMVTLKKYCSRSIYKMLQKSPKIAWSWCKNIENYSSYCDWSKCVILAIWLVEKYCFVVVGNVHKKLMRSLELFVGKEQAVRNWCRLIPRKFNWWKIWTETSATLWLNTQWSKKPSLFADSKNRITAVTLTFQFPLFWFTLLNWFTLTKI